MLPYDCIFLTDSLLGIKEPRYYPWRNCGEVGGTEAMEYIVYAVFLYRLFSVLSV